MNMTHDFELPTSRHFAQLAWQNAYGAYLAALATEPADGPPDPTDEEIDAFAERVDEARDRMIKCPAPDAAAVALKLEPSGMMRASQSHGSSSSCSAT